MTIMSKFRPYDRVRVTAPTDPFYDKVGTVATVDPEYYAAYTVTFHNQDTYYYAATDLILALGATE